MLKKIFLTIIFSSLFAQVFAQENTQQDNNHIMKGTLTYRYEGESFVTIFSAWQDIKIHSFNLLELESSEDAETRVYPAGEVFELNADKYSTSYVFVKSINTSRGLRIANIQFDMLILEGKVIINYKMLTSKDRRIGLLEENLQKMAQQYEKNMTSLNASFVSYFTGMIRLSREYHGINIEVLPPKSPTE